MRTRPIISAITILFFFVGSALAQTQKAEGATFQFGAQVIAIPAPEGFEEAASQFETIKTLMTSTESPNNDMLAVHLPHADC